MNRLDVAGFDVKGQSLSFLDHLWSILMKMNIKCEEPTMRASAEDVMQPSKQMILGPASDRRQDHASLTIVLCQHCHKPYP